MDANQDPKHAPIEDIVRNATTEEDSFPATLPRTLVEFLRTHGWTVTGLLVTIGPAGGPQHTVDVRELRRIAAERAASAAAASC